MISPYLAHQVIFFGVPLGWLVYLTFAKWNYLTPPRFYGLRNFTNLFSDRMFWLVLANTFNFMAYFVPLSLLLGILFGLALQKMKHFKTFVALSFLLANISSGVAYSIVFSRILSENGPINRGLYAMFGFTIPWFSRPQLAIFSIVMMVTWKFIGYYGLIFLAGLGAIPRSLYEAAELDGATRWKRFTRITLPLLNPSIVMVLVMQITLSFGIFTEPYLITGGGPMKRTYMFMMFIYDNAFRKFTSTGPGYAATISVIAAAISFGCIFLSRRLVEREVDLS
ncbi:MAG TPA: sugar ABC transporter permease [Thermotogota bacterium]|nr:sugar ABC transporter permease [Thermotogota bacterium]HRW93924.1 sugar ABC transporter permease [Thermotogota bacterium]